MDIELVGHDLKDLEESDDFSTSQDTRFQYFNQARLDLISDVLSGK